MRCCLAGVDAGVSLFREWALNNLKAHTTQDYFENSFLNNQARTLSVDQCLFAWAHVSKFHVDLSLPGRLL